jgi:hypothetical protein
MVQLIKPLEHHDVDEPASETLSTQSHRTQITLTWLAPFTKVKFLWTRQKCYSVHTWPNLLILLSYLHQCIPCVYFVVVVHTKLYVSFSCMLHICPSYSNWFDQHNNVSEWSRWRDTPVRGPLKTRIMKSFLNFLSKPHATCYLYSEEL